MTGDVLQADDPRQLGGYELLSRLGEGGMGVVYLAQDERGSPVAIKTLHRSQLASEELRTRFRQEIQLTLRVASPYVAQVLAADYTVDPPFYVTEYVPGETLAERVERTGALSEPELVALGAALAHGLSAMHRHGIAHRDLTPNNVVLSPLGPKIIDLGIARIDDATRMTRTGTSIGTPAWMSPEQARGSEVSTQTDIFAWGGLMAFAASAEPPFGIGDPHAVIYRIVHERPVTLAVPERLSATVEQSLSKDPSNRPTAEALVLALTELSVRTNGGTEAVTQLVRAGDWSDSLKPSTKEVTVAKSEAEEQGTRQISDTKTGPDWRVAVGILGVLALLGGAAAIFADSAEDGEFAAATPSEESHSEGPVEPEVSPESSDDGEAPEPEPHTDLSGLTLTVASKDFDEQLILGEISVALLEDANANVINDLNLGGTDAIRPAIESGDIDHYWEYTGTAWLSFYAEQSIIPDRMAQYEAVRDREATSRNLHWLAPTQFNNTYGLAISQDADRSLGGLDTLSDLAALLDSDPQAATICAGSEFLSYDDGLSGLEAHYGIDIPASNVTELDLDAIYTAIADRAPCNIGEVFTTDGRVAVENLKVLADDRVFFPLYNAAPVFTAEVFAEYGNVLEGLFAPVVTALDDSTMQRLNSRVSAHGEAPAKVAREWLHSNDFID